MVDRPAPPNGGTSMPDTTPGALWRVGTVVTDKMVQSYVNGFMAHNENRWEFIRTGNEHSLAAAPDVLAEGGG